jgi:dihydrofolate reductase
VWDENAAGFQGELTRRYNRIPKYVASRTLTEVGWKNSRLLGPDVPAAVAELRAEPGGEIRVWGSTELIRTLAEHDLVDEYRLAVYPLVLGTGKKLFSDGFALARLTLVDSRALRSGVVVNTYRRSAAGRTVRLEVQQQNEKGVSYWRRQHFVAVGSSTQQVGADFLSIVTMERQLESQP